MKSNSTHATALFLLALIVVGCRTAAKQAPTESQPTAASRVGSDTAPKDTGAGSSDVKASNPPVLSGAYTISELDYKGQVYMVGSDNEIVMNFFPSGDFTRVTKKQGKVFHTDSGTFTIDGPDQLVLVATLADKKLLEAPVEKRHKFSISQDGEELKLDGQKGSIAVFRRTKRFDQKAQAP